MSRTALAMLLIVLAPSSASAQEGTRYAFLVGCSGYDRTQLRPLPSPINDVEEFKKALLATGFEADHIKMLHDKQAERRYFSEKAKILKELALLLDGIRPNDTLVVALSGHGVHFKGDATGYFCPVDAKLNDKSTLIPMDGPGGLFELLKSCKAKRKLLIVNACRNDPSSDLAQAANRVNLDDEDGDKVPEGIAAIYSCKAGQKSYYDDRRNLGIFFDHVIRSWKGEYHRADTNLTLEAFFDQVITKTKSDVDRTLGESQVPVVRRDYTGGEWLLTEKSRPIDADASFRLAQKFDYGIGERIDKAAALKHYREAAGAGHPLAQVELSVFARKPTGGAIYNADESKGLAQKAFPEVQRRAEAGDPMAMYYLGMIHAAGLGGEPNPKEGFRWYRDASDKGVLQATCNLGQLYADGLGVEESKVQAVGLFRKAAERGFADGHFLLGIALELGQGVKEDVAGAVREYRKAAAQNHPPALTSLGNCYINGVGVEANPTEAFKFYQRAADQQEPEGHYVVANLYLEGRGCDKNPLRAIDHYRKAAAWNHSGAQVQMGILSRDGFEAEMKINLADALKWFRRASDNGNHEGTNNLGWMYADGKGVEKDEVEAVRLFKLAADDEDADGLDNLGWMYENGLGVKADPVKALELYRKSADQGYATAQVHLGILLVKGRGTKPDAKEAAVWFRKAADQNDPLGMTWLGSLLRDGNGVEMDAKAAFTWFEKSADLGYGHGQYLLGDLYENGNGVNANVPKAIDLYTKAAAKGVTDAVEALKRLNVPAPTKKE